MSASLATDRRFTPIDMGNIASIDEKPSRPQRGPRLIRMSPPMSLNERARFDEYLMRLEEGPIRLDPAHAAHVRTCWRRLAERVPGLPLPASGPSVDGFQFAWSLTSLIVQIDVLEDGSFHWYAAERPVTHGAGSEAPCAVLPDELFGWLARVARR